MGTPSTCRITMRIVRHYARRVDDPIPPIPTCISRKRDHPTLAVTRLLASMR